MTILEIIAEQSLGAHSLAKNPELRARLQRLDASVRERRPGEDEKARIASIVELCSAYESESAIGEKENILRTLEEVTMNETLELPNESIEKWEEDLASNDQAFASAKDKLDQRRREFQKRYFSLRARAGLETQEAVAKRTGLRRSYIAVIEAGMHFPQQKTLQKLAKAFKVDVADLLT